MEDDPEGKSLTQIAGTVRKFDRGRSPAVFSELQCETNLNLPPANWLSEINKRYGIKFNSNSQGEFTSFNIASAFVECIGEVDVVSDAENIKKLLKIPFSKNSVSMLVHRIGKTLLIDDFDICKHLIRNEESEWKWLSKLYQEILREYQAKDKVLCRASKSRDVLLEKKLESKFLCHTIESAENSVAGFIRPDGAIPLPDPTEGKQVQRPFGREEEEFEVEANLTGFSRNIVWTFEEIRMLVGSDMPIFGDGRHPYVSLRLRDMNKPISVLTGMDYWLDNLMCNVPEVVMCCHLGGIVKQYELHKTEDLPNLKGSEFSPSDVRDVAKNILAFLKSKATKAGHTYWLFRGKGDDVVKLYDLTSICTEVMDDPSLNPVTVPLGILLYKVAFNMYRSSSFRRQQGVIRTLLTSCLPLLQESKHLDYIATALYILNDLYVPSDLDPASPNLPADNEADGYDDDDESLEEEEEDVCEERCSVSVESLCGPSDPLPHKEKRFRGITESLEIRCLQGLKYGIDALRRLMAKADSDIPKNRKPDGESEPEMARPFNPIPMPYEPLIKPQSKNPSREKMEIQLRTRLGAPVQTEQKLSQLDELKCAFLYKFVLSYLTLAEVDFNEREFGRTLHNIRMAARVWELLESYRHYKEATDALVKLKTYALAVAGDAVYVIMQRWASEASLQREAYNNAWKMVDNDVLDVLEQIAKSREGMTRESTEDITFPSSLETALELSKKCYLRSLHFGKQCPNFAVIKRRRKLPQAPESEKKNDYDIPGLLRRLGNIHNDLGVYYMNLVTSVSGDDKIDVTECLRKSKEFLNTGFEYFKEVDDVGNMALLKSNYGRLFRLRSHYEKRRIEDEMSAKEQKYTSQAIESYKEALEILSRRDGNPAIWDAIQWELSTTLFNAGCMLQENPPISVKDFGEIDREVVSYFLSCLKFSTVDDTNSRQPLYQYRIATVHHRLGAQYHSSLRRSEASATARSKFYQLAEKHYKIASEMFLEMDLLPKYIGLQLEKADLLLVQSQAEDHRLKCMRSALFCLLNCQPVIHKLCQKDFVAKTTSSSSSEDQDLADVDATLKAFLTKILKFLLQVIQLLAQSSKKPGKRQQASGDLETFKEAYQILLKVNQKDESHFIQKLDQEFQSVYKMFSENELRGS